MICIIAMSRRRQLRSVHSRRSAVTRL